MNRGDYTRRRILLGGSTTVLASLAGCSSSDDDDDGTGAAASDPDTDAGNDAWDIETPDDPAFLANPDVVGPAEDAKFVLSTTVRDYAEIDEYSSFEVAVNAVVLHRVDGDDVSVPVDVVVDLTAYETGPTGELVTLAWGLGIPTGTYTSMTLDMTAEELVHETDGDVTDAFEDPPVSEFASDDGVEVSDDGALGSEMTLAVGYEFGTPTVEESPAVDTSTMDRYVLDPSQYEN